MRPEQILHPSNESYTSHPPTDPNAPAQPWSPDHERHTRHLRVVSSDERAPAGRSFSLIVAVIALISALVAGVVVYAWQHPKVNDAQASADAAQASLAAAQAAQSGLEQQVATLTDQLNATDVKTERLITRTTALAERVHRQQVHIQDLQAQVTSQEQANAALEDQLATTQDRLANTKAELAATQDRWATAHARALELAGPALADGKYVSRFEGIDAAATPHLAADVTGRADGSALASPGWRVFTVDPSTQVTLKTWKGGHTVSLSEFERIFDGTAPWNAAMRDVRYTIRISGSEVVAITERR
jgi:hypothetical protein